MNKPLSTSFIAVDLPTARTSLWVPPAPGIIPKLISGWPELGGIPGNNNIGMHRQLAATAERIAIDCGDQGLGKHRDAPPNRRPLVVQNADHIL